MDFTRLRVLGVFLASAAAACWMAWWFVTPALWAAFIAVGIWPLYEASRDRAMKTIPALARRLPLAVGGALLLAVGLMLGLVIQAGIEEAKNLASADAWGSLRARLESSGALTWLHSLPLVGPKIAKHLSDLDPAGIAEHPNLMGLLFESGHWGKEIFSWIGASICCALALSGLLTHGPILVGALRTGAQRLLGPSFSEHLDHQAALTRSIFNSIVVLGAAESLLFWGAYGLSGLRQPALLALLTGAASMIPLASTILSGLACLYLALSGSLLAALLLGIFSATVLLVVDPVVRPLLAGKNTEMPFWLTTLAMLAGIQSVGLIGVFLGPQLFLLLIHLGGRICPIREQETPPNR